MKTFTILFVLHIVTIIAKAQTVPSICTAPDTIVQKYIHDANRLALRKIYSQNLTYRDSIFIPHTHSDTILKALLAVYNATSLPARDSVVTLFNIHTHPIPDINHISISADSNLAWIIQLKNGIIPTGYSTLDSLMDTYSLNIDDYITWFGIVSFHTVSLVSDSDLNPPPLSNLFDSLAGVLYSEPGNSCCDGDDIYATIYTDHVELIYSVGWEDCPSGCIRRHGWKFNIYYDCSVEFEGSFGTTLLITNISSIAPDKITAYPNPFSQSVQLDGLSKDMTFLVTNLMGEVILSGQTVNGNISGMDNLPAGVYLLTIKGNADILKTIKLSKMNIR